MDKKTFWHSLLSGIASNAIFALILAGGAVLAFAAAWVRRLSDFERGGLFTLALVVVCVPILLIFCRYSIKRQVTDAVAAATALTDLSPRPRIKPRLSVQIRTDQDAYVIVQNLGETVVVRAPIIAVSGVKDWPAEPVLATWEGINEGHIKMAAGEARRVVAAKFEAVMRERKGRWRIPYLKDGEMAEVLMPWYRDIDSVDSIGPFEIRVTIVTDGAEFVQVCTFDIQGGSVRVR